MSITIEKNCFSGLSEALADIRVNKLWPTTSVIEQSKSTQLHWHSEDVWVYVLEGSPYWFDKYKKKHVTEPGDRVKIPAKTLHAEGKILTRAVFIIALPKPLPKEKFLLERRPEKLQDSIYYRSPF